MATVCAAAAWAQAAAKNGAQGEKKASQALAARLMNLAGDRQRLQLAIQQIQLQAQLLEKQLAEAQKAFMDADRGVQEALESLMQACGASRDRNDANLQALRQASEGGEVSCREAFPERSRQ